MPSSRTRSLWWALLGSAAALLLACGSSAERPDCSDGLVLTEVTVIDGLGNPPAPDQMVVVCDGRIVAVGPAGEVPMPRRAKKVALPGRTVMPGLIDTHAHVTVLPLDSDSASDEAIDLEASKATLRTLVGFGVTTVRNPAAPAREGVALREAVASGEILGPTIRTAGEALNPQAGTIGPLVATPDLDAVRAEVRRQAALGVDHIKLYSSLPPALVEAAVTEAHLSGLTVVGHLQATTWTAGARLGVDHITHGAPWSLEYLPAELRVAYYGTLLDRLTWLENVDLEGPEIAEMIAALAEHEVSVDPTLIAHRVKFFGDDPFHTSHPELDLAAPQLRAAWSRTTFTDGWSADDYARGHAAWPQLLALTRKLFEGGVLLTVGTDLPTPWVIPGVSYHQELELLTEAGIPPLEVLRMATHNGARALGLESETGSVEPGKRADLLVLAASPLKRIANTRAIELVLLAGRPLSPSAVLATPAG